MAGDRFEATYLIETPLDPAHVAEVLAGEQSCGTFTRVDGETDALRQRARATVNRSSCSTSPSARRCPTAGCSGAACSTSRSAGSARRLRVSFPVANVGANLPTLAAIVSGNLFDLGEVTGLRLER
jgi:ribulose-bisphosphate carboxylase large chain